MPTCMSNLFVLTGGPGSGKTSVIDALRDAGHICSAETGRQIIQQQVAVKGNALPWRDRGLYAEMMLNRELEAYNGHAGSAEAVFFDRGLPDVIGYLRLEGLPVPAPMMQAARTLRYAKPVFLFPPWPEIFTQDAERKQTPGIAEKTYQAMNTIYGELGYDLIKVPKTSIPERMRFILATCSKLC